MSAGDVSNSEFVGNLYQDHRGWLLAWLNRSLGHRQRVEDLSQDTFVRLLGRPELPGLREPHAFLTRVAHGLMTDHFRRAALEQAYLAELALVPEAEQPSVEEQYLILENLREIDRLPGTLSLKARSAFLYSYLGNMPHAEVAERLGVLIPCVHQYLAQGLRQCYIAFYGEPQ